MAAQDDHAHPAILVADDSFVNQLSARAMLSELGYPEPRTAINGAEAVAACQRQRFDLILMDCEMPEMDGLQATARLRAMGITTPIVAFTASGSAYNRERCLQAGMDDFLDKPARREALAATLARWLGAGKPSPTEAPDFDPGAFVRMFDGNDLLFGEALRVFERHTGPALALLQAALARGDLEAGRHLAHRIRGSAATLGAMLLAEHCGVIEQAASRDAPGLAQAVDGALQAYRRFLVESHAALDERVRRGEC